MKGYTQIGRLGFPELIMPGLQRHDFYVTMDSGELGKSDVEVTVVVRLDSGEDATSCIAVSAGEKPVSSDQNIMMTELGGRIQISSSHQSRKSYLERNLQYQTFGANV
jgi:hypothetical protein